MIIILCNHQYLHNPIFKRTHLPSTVKAKEIVVVVIYDIPPPCSAIPKQYIVHISASSTPTINLSAVLEMVQRDLHTVSTFRARAALETKICQSTPSDHGLH